MSYANNKGADQPAHVLSCRGSFVFLFPRILPTPSREYLILVLFVFLKTANKSRKIRCSQTVFMLQKVNIMPGETFTLNSDDFETTRYLSPQ